MELLDSVGLDRKLADRYPVQLSGGQQQRVGVARALAADPLVMLMDEPFSAVDPVVRAELHEFFLTLQRQISKTIILITHDIDEAIKLGDQVAILRVGGRLAQVGTPQQLLDEPADAFVEGFVGRDRGYRSLSFQPASALDLDTVPVVRDVAAARGAGHTLVVDGEARPRGWVDPAQPGHTLPLGATFDVESGTLRNALDAVLTSPVGLAVGVQAGSGRYAGVVATETVLAAMKRTKTRQVQESVTVAPGSRDADEDQLATDQPATDQPATDQPATDETVVRRGAHVLGTTTASDEAEDAHGVSAELGDESGQDVEPEALAPDEGRPGDDPDVGSAGAPEADLVGYESALSTEESRAAGADADDVDARR
jgi:osmoprotectant transport system ATP-binding protein